MKVGVLVPDVTGRVRFSLADKKLVPARHGCYALISADDEVLYVGQASNLAVRLDNHTDDIGKRAMVGDKRAAYFAFLECAPTELGRIERGWMNQYMALHGKLPPLNKVYSPVR